ncbi:hypothetical protein GP475_10425 [Corynebacterium poyangense]|uniref:Uncharacterized protein n=1 Tax=Corynebacterium poyangense TaxID=2684405 RepID=A0A7H0SR22_9CORY|nr:hypothetical protein [Corynebacterium poyangense]MBZ8176419.1 hypothetical protein [Corynebacterium poyangense]QNQ90997.1 hypothetical protein GP475_10425 [Corynebacterium poyangense]
MPPKVTDTRPNTEAIHAVEEETARGARNIVATFAQDFMDGVTLMCMLGVEPEGLSHKKVAAEYEAAHPKKTTKRTRKSTKKTTKKSTAKKTTKKATKKTTKKTSVKKTSKKATKKS